LAREGTLNAQSVIVRDAVRGVAGIPAKALDSARSLNIYGAVTGIDVDDYE